MQNHTLLHRQVHPSFLQAGQVSALAFSVSSQAFKPFPKDDHKLSVYNGELFSPQASYEHYSPNYPSAGVLSVTPDECASIGLAAMADNTPFEGHAHIDFGQRHPNACNKLAKLLREKAVQRGWTYKP
jgi:hypothetical protein